MRVRLKSAATIRVQQHADHPAQHDWFPAGAECDIADEDFDPQFHEDLTPPPEPEPAAEEKQE